MTYTEYGTAIEVERNFYGLDFSVERMLDFNNIFRADRIVIILAVILTAYYVSKYDGELMKVMLIALGIGVLTVLIVNALDTNLSAKPSTTKDEKKGG